MLGRPFRVCMAERQTLHSLGNTYVARMSDVWQERVEIGVQEERSSNKATHLVCPDFIKTLNAVVILGLHFAFIRRGQASLLQSGPIDAFEERIALDVIEAILAIAKPFLWIFL